MRQLFLCLACSVPFFLDGQVNVVNLDLVDGAPNVFYQGFEHNVKVVGVDSSKFLGLGVSEGKVFPSRDWNRFVVNMGSAETTTLTIHCADIPDTNVVFTAGNWVDPVAWLGMLPDTVATVEEILEHPVLHAPMPGSYLKEYFHVMTFDLKLISAEGGDLFEFQRSFGNRLLPKQIREIKRLKSGDVLRFSCIATCPSCALRKLPDLNIHVR